jgi:heme/copper-type cytochrome/quinol oxidase subunit 1
LVIRFLHWYEMMFYNTIDLYFSEIIFFWIFLRVNLIFFPMHHMRIHRIPRRYFAYDISMGYINNLCLLGILISGLSWVLVVTVMIMSRDGRLGISYDRNRDEISHGSNLPPHTYM